MKEKRKDLTPPYFRYLVHLIRPFPDFDFSFIKPVRRKAVELLKLKQGDRVLDMGCGPGGSFPYIVDVVGPSGEVVGVEISPEVTINARRRIARNEWRNVRVIEASAQTVNLTGTFDGLLMFAAADVYASEEALENIFPHVRENARVALFGAKTSSNRLGRILNPFLKMLFKLSFSTTPRPDYEPWRILARYVERLDVEEYFFGLMFLASGSVITKKPNKKLVVAY
ncbi:MAG: methyltransferase domain-containing protein [Ignavibacteria bacterium]|nr:methyltransferase domain-containing protein [Ignavibacteria bacterium]MBI3765629.1 methyltransferase domain-containing protein [Ignavibacteriales bacterium]